MIINIDKEDLQHILAHLCKNRMDTDYGMGWFKGNRELFLKRHVELKKKIQDMIKALERVEKTGS